MKRRCKAKGEKIGAQGKLRQTARFIIYKVYIYIYIHTYIYIRNCVKYVQSNMVPSRLLPNTCLLNPGRGEGLVNSHVSGTPKI